MNKTDKQVLNDVFRELRKKGFVARQNYWCCQSCAWSAVESEYDTNDDSNIVFYHNQDADAFENGNLESILYLAWQGDGETIRDTFEDYGFNVAWDGTKNKRIGILPRRTVYEVTYKTSTGRLDTIHALSERQLDEFKREIEWKELELVEIVELESPVPTI